MKIDLDAAMGFWTADRWRRHRPRAWPLPLLLLLSLLAPATAADSEPYPEFIAVYDAQLGGITVAEATFSLRRLDDGDYLYQREMTSVGIAALFGAKMSIASSRWRFVDGRIRALEFRSRDEDGDADDNLHLLFDWQASQVKNISTMDPWQTEMPPGTMDKLLMQLVLLIDLRAGEREFHYQVAHQGRIKDYHFKQVGTEMLELPVGSFETLVVERLNEDRDTTRIWSAAQLDYLPARYLKVKKGGADLELSLREFDLIDRGVTD